MASCDLCGKTGQLFRALVEGVHLTVCESCCAMGKVIGRVEPAASSSSPKSKAKKPSKPEVTVTSVIAGDYSKRIRTARERLAFSQKELSLRINEKESVLGHLENGKIRPSIELARKLERLLSIVLIEHIQEVKEEAGTESPAKGKQGADLTLGDVITIRKQKTPSKIPSKTP